jgi:hypothetical protein
LSQAAESRAVWTVDRTKPEMAQEDRNRDRSGNGRGEPKGTHGAIVAIAPDVQTSGSGPWPFEETTVFFPRRFAS